MTSPYFERLKSSGPEAAEFLANVQPIGLDRGPEPLTPGASDYTCWIWQGSTGSRGYAREGSTPISRRSHELFVGPIPEGQRVKRTCGNGLCVNPRHLCLATPADCTGKLTGKEREQVAAALDAGEHQTAIARRFGITQPAVSAIKNKRDEPRRPAQGDMSEWLNKQVGRLGLVGQLARGAAMPPETLERALDLATKEWTTHDGLLREYETRRRSGGADDLAHAAAEQPV
jgi:hypothetical protein